MAQPEADRCDVDEAEVAFGGLVISGSDTARILQLVEATLHQVTKAIERPDDTNTILA